MPRFFFHVFGHETELDEVGTEFPDIYVAQAQGIRYGAEMLAAVGVKLWDKKKWRLEVCDKAGELLFIMRISLEEYPLAGAKVYFLPGGDAGNLD